MNTPKFGKISLERLMYILLNHYGEPGAALETDDGYRVEFLTNDEFRLTYPSGKVETRKYRNGMERQFVIVNDRYGEPDAKTELEIIIESGMLGFEVPHKVSRLCQCGEGIEVLVNDTGEIVAVQFPHQNHQPW